MLSRILATTSLKPIPLRTYPNGLASVREGLEDMKAGQVCHISACKRIISDPADEVHAEKITYLIADTPGLVC
jgi:hypothetical protein